VLVDISSYAVGVVAAEILTYRLTEKAVFPSIWPLFSVAICILIGLLFGMPSFFTPKYPLYMDHNTGVYGIPSSK